MKKAFLLVLILFISVISTACINNLAVQELNNKAKEYLEQNDYESAINRLKASLDLDSTIFETHYNLGIAYTQAEKYPEAIETFNNAIKLRPSFTDIYYSLGVAQENYAKGIIDGSIKEDGSEKALDNAKQDSELQDTNPSEKKLTPKQKALVSQLFSESIVSYQTYLKKGKDLEDKKEVEEKIEYLQKQLEKYAENIQETE